MAARKIGILAIHGDVAEHAAILRKLNFEPVEVRERKDFEGLSGLVLPGGESTTIFDLLETFGLRKPLEAFVKSGKPILATCAGLILLAKLRLLDVAVKRNAYGRQLDSFEARIKITPPSSPLTHHFRSPLTHHFRSPLTHHFRSPLTHPFKGGIEAAFIRAPKILEVGKVEVLAKFEGVPVFVRQRNIFATSFHPEITGEIKIHEFIFKK